MGKILKLLLGIIGSLIALLIIAAIAIPLFIDPNDFRDEINAQVSEKTGRTLKIEGDLGLSIFPWLGIDTGAIELGNAKGFGDSPFARIESSQIRVKLLPLLKKELEMDTLVLKGLDLNLQRQKNGQDNWSDLAGTPQPTEQAQDDSSDQPTLAALAIGGIELENARVHFDDRQANKQFTTSALNLTTGSLEPGAPVALKLRGDINSSAPAMNGHIDLTTTLQANPFAGSYALEDMKLAVDLKGKDLPGGQLQARAGANVSADLSKQTLGVNSLSLNSGPLQVNGDVQLARINSADPGLQGSLKITPFKPRELFGLLGMTAPLTADPKALHQASLETRLAGSVQHLQLNDLQLILDDSLVTGKLALRSGKQTRVSYDLKVDGINVDRYLPPPAQQQGKGLGIISTAVAAPAAQPLIPVELLRGFDMAGAVQVGKLIAAGLLIENADVTINLARGLLKLDPIQGQVYGGRYNGHISVDASRQQGNLPVLSANESLQNVQIGPVLKAVTGSDTLLGQGNISARLTARGQDMPALRSSLNGNLATNLVNGAINGINVAHELRKAYAIYKGQPAPAEGDTQQTDFSELSATAMVVNGVVINRDLTMKSPLLRINGEGKIDLVREQIDYKLNTAVVGSLTGQGGVELKELKGVTVPIAIKGNLTDPSFSLDLGRILEQRLKQELQKKLQDKLQDSLLGKPKEAPSEPSSQQAPSQEERVKDLFKGLFR
jgi:AsmA protein